MSYFEIDLKQKFLIDWILFKNTINENQMFNESIIKFNNNKNICYVYIYYTKWNNNFIIDLFEVFPKNKGFGNFIMKKLRIELLNFNIIINNPLDETLEFWYKMLKLNYINEIKNKDIILDINKIESLILNIKLNNNNILNYNKKLNNLKEFEEFIIKDFEKILYNMETKRDVEFIKKLIKN